MVFQMRYHCQVSIRAKKEGNIIRSQYVPLSGLLTSGEANNPGHRSRSTFNRNLISSCVKSCQRQGQSEYFWTPPISRYFYRNWVTNVAGEVSSSADSTREALGTVQGASHRGHQRAVQIGMGHTCRIRDLSAFGGFMYSTLPLGKVTLIEPGCGSALKPGEGGREDEEYDWESWG